MLGSLLGMLMRTNPKRSLDLPNSVLATYDIVSRPFTPSKDPHAEDEDAAGGTDAYAGPGTRIETVAGGGGVLDHGVSFVCVLGEDGKGSC